MMLKAEAGSGYFCIRSFTPLSLKAPALALLMHWMLKASC
jgi:hypothetical protein